MRSVKIFLIPAEAVSQFASYGGGRAPEGKCGSLYAAEYLLQRNYPEKIQECQRRYLSIGGSTQCRQIRAMKKLSCVGCVELAAKLLEGVVCARQ